MYVLVADGSADVRDADDCTSLEVRVAASDGSSLSDALTASGLGRWDGGSEVELIIEELHTHAHAAETAPDWEQRWLAMLAYATRKGWVSSDETTVRAHVVVGPALA